MSQYFSKVVYQTLYKEEIKKQKMTKDQQEDLIAGDRIQIVAEFLRLAIDNWRKKTGGTLPKQIVVYRDGVGGPTLE